MAANCIRSLLVQPAPTASDQTIARYLLPRLINFVTDIEPEDPERARSLVAQTLVQYVGVLRSKDKDRVAVGMALVLPTLLARAAAEGEEAYGETSARLLELAAADQTAFRAVVAGMSEGQKGFLEEVIRWGRQSGGAGAGRSDGAAGQPTIALKMNFGG
jgi:HEAT repeat-containing protein 5